MSFSNIQSVRKTEASAAVSGRTRLLGVYFTHTATSATITLKDGSTSGGSAKLTVTSPAAIGSQDLIIPDMGILFESGIYIDLSSSEITSVTLLLRAERLPKTRANVRIGMSFIKSWEVAMEWSTVLTHLLELEGGFTDDPNDPGNKLPDSRPGCTNLGVTQAAWERYVGRQVTHDEMRALTRQDVDPFYRSLYWDSIRADELPPLIRYAVFDAGVNSGPGTAIKWLQEAVGATPDGALGPKTLAAINELNPEGILRRMLAKRLTAMTSMSGWPSFSRGWARRIATLLEA